MREIVPDELMNVPPKIQRPPSGIRGSSGYNLFCSSFFQSGKIGHTISVFT